MLAPDLTFLLLLIIEGCVGPMTGGKNCSAQNFSVRIPYETLDSCETARRKLIAPESVLQHVKALCLVAPKAPK